MSIMIFGRRVFYTEVIWKYTDGSNELGYLRRCHSATMRRPPTLLPRQSLMGRARR